MRPLTPRLWAEHFTQLWPHVLAEFPDVPREELEPQRDDWNGVVALIQRRTGLSSELVEQRLRKLDVDALGIGTGTIEEPVEPSGDRASLAQLRLGDGFSRTDQPLVAERLAKLDRRLKAFPADGTVLELSVKDRDSTAQKMTLECRLPHFAKIVATSHEHDLRDALNDVRDDLWRQIDDALARRKQGVS